MCCHNVLQVNSSCSSGLDKGTGKGILRPVSNCPYYYKFSNKAVHKNDKKNPRCTNAPMLCNGCPNPTYVWKYDMQSHWQTHHPDMLDQVGLCCTLAVD